MKLFGEIFRGKRILLTGHTGFKGSWLALWLRELGADVIGLALPPETHPNHWDTLALDIDDRRMDIRDALSLQQLFGEVCPELVLHLAAQPIVRHSYSAPLETWSTNVMGTANVLEACRHTASVKAVLVVTTDKCYENREWPWGYREMDALGGHDPYSASKAGAELVVASYRKAFFHAPESPLIATARGGNVIGGGDWSEGRLIPDLVRAVRSGQSLEIRSPSATRPWQHVLDSLSGYLLLASKLLKREQGFADAWNFGPNPEGNRKVAEVLSEMGFHWPKLHWHLGLSEQVHESKLLYLDSAKARMHLNWKPTWKFDQAIERTVYWYQAWYEREELISQRQLLEYVESSRAANNEWASE